MRWGYYGILIIFIAFFLLLILSPSLTCFGKRLKSPFYPLFRRKKRARKIETEDYGFSLVENKDRQKVDEIKQKMASRRSGAPPKEDEPKKAPGKRKKRLKTTDYGFSLSDDDEQ